jgi:hypothetical protein
MGIHCERLRHEGQRELSGHSQPGSLIAKDYCQPGSERGFVGDPWLPYINLMSHAMLQVAPCQAMAYVDSSLLTQPAWQSPAASHFTG